MSNIKSEQLKNDFTIELALDQPLTTKEMQNLLIKILGKDNCSIKEILNKDVFCYNHDNKQEILLLSAVTYLGGNGQHPVFKKRSQLKNWYKDIVELFETDNNVNVRFVGVYHYKDNIVFAEFIKDTYIKRKLNSSAAHVYINDIYQGMKYGIFKKTDKRLNEIVTIKDTKFKEYLDGKSKASKLLDLIDLFNKKTKLGDWLYISQAIPEMYKAKWPKWKETEWAGWYLEFLFDKFIKENCLEDKMKYVSNKKNTVNWILTYGLMKKIFLVI